MPRSLHRLEIPLNATANALRVELAFRIRTGAPSEWNEFSNLWMAFNAIYGGEPDEKERSRVMMCIRRNFTDRAALRVLRAVTRSIDLILEVPPANLLLNRDNPKFRAASQRYTAMYRNRTESSVGRLAAVGGVLYQIRCNLIHGSKDPHNERDRMLVRESVSVLRVLVPALEEALP
ncbi:hypothetical protein TFLX_03092 [Thermoflexales bacterium]|nr:hypothetical protein TFLX_03092 [Thermoflexales bacterium]